MHNKLFQNSLKLLILIILFSSVNIFAQKYHNIPLPEAKLKKGINLFDNHMYGDAYTIFNEITKHDNRIGYNDIHADAEYYSAICALKLNHADAEYQMAQFISRNPESPRIQRACFFMGWHKYKNQEWQEAINWFSKVDRYNLSNNEIAEFYFKKGYSYLMLNKEDKAYKLFYELLDFPQSEFYSAGVYYYSHIAYKKNNLETALKGFETLKTDPSFSPIVPYYTAHIYFLQKKYDKVISYIPQIINLVTPSRKIEMKKMVGDAFFKINKFDSAISYLEEYKKDAKNFSRYDIYQLAYSYYKTSQFKKSASNFSLITNKNDSLSQNAFYHMADCYIKLNDKKSARLAFGNASRFDFNKKISEDALFNYAKLSYELSYTPFNQIITIFNSYIKKYPKSKKIDLMYKYMIDIYITSKNYELAEKELNKIKVKTQRINNAIQKVDYYRGVELYNNLKYNEAYTYFAKSLTTHGNNQHLTALARYWKSECLYNNKNYSKAAYSYTKFIETPGSFKTEFYNLSNYNLGYCYFKLKDYNNAVIWYRKFIDNATNESLNYKFDALVRLADSYFMQRKYKQALDAYSIASEIPVKNYNYSVFQKGITYGILHNYEQKISTLKPLSRDTSSLFCDDALFEIGKSYMNINQPENSISSYELLIKLYPNSNYLKKCYLNAGLLYFNSGDNNKAEQYFKYLIENYKGSDEYNEALVALKNVYLDKNNIDEYLNYASKNKINITSNEQDSLMYLAAQKAYLNNKIDESIDLFQKYLTQFGNGKFNLKAHFYLAQSYFKTKKYDLAKKQFEIVASKPRNSFTQTTLFNLGTIEEINKNYEEAYKYFAKLEPIVSNSKTLLDTRLEIMNCATKTSNNKLIIEIAQKILITENISEQLEQETRYNMAMAYYKLNDYTNAQTQFRLLAENTQLENGAKANFYIALIDYKAGKISLAQEEINNFIKKGSPHQFWLGKAFILLAQTYRTQNELFQAKAYLQSVITNYGDKNDGIIEEAKDSLSKITGAENKKFNETQENSIEIDMSKTKKKNNNNIK